MDALRKTVILIRRLIAKLFSPQQIDFHAAVPGFCLPREPQNFVSHVGTQEKLSLS